MTEVAVKPRYRLLAEELEQRIEDGAYIVGDQLPPETELCREFSVSRHTMRDALRLLREAGLVERRRGSGTTVLSRKPRPAFIQPLGGMDDILQFAQDARLVIRRTDRRPLTSAERRRIRTDSEDWLVVEALRVSNSGPVALSEIYIRGDFADIIDKIESWDGAVIDLIEREHGKKVSVIEQEISADTLSAAAARVLGSDQGAGVLQTLRRYYDEDDQVMLASDSVGAGSRFVYTMRFRRGG